MGKRIIVDITSQVLHAYHGDELVYRLPCVSGDRDHATPFGHFRVLRKLRICRSRKYDAQMNYAMFFTTQGHAIHEALAVPLMSLTRVALRAVGLAEEDPFGSHGCVRLSGGDAPTLFDWTPVHTRVSIVQAHVPVVAPLGPAAGDPRMTPNHVPGRRS
ncbi:MAG: L,D-transpeptidase [Gemmataceae bacterium]